MATSLRSACCSTSILSLRLLLDEHPQLLSHRGRIGEWYEAGYFQGAMLLHHVAGNPIRRPLPGNIIEVARLLLERGADPDAATDNGSATVDLLLTSLQASEAGVAVPLVELLRASGARVDLHNPDILAAPLWNGGRATAEELVWRGTKPDLPYAAVVGPLSLLADMLAAGPDSLLIEDALIYACAHAGGLGSARRSR